MSRPLDIACLQTRPMPDFQSALDEAMPMAQAAAKAGAQILFLPEYCGGLQSDGAALRPPSAPQGAHPVLQAMQDFAASEQITINLGSIAVEGPDGRILNRGFMIGPTGALIGHYDKIHLFDIQLSDDEVYRESETVSPGGTAVIHDTAHARIGHTICYDLRFADLFRALAQGGADILICPAAFTQKTGEAHWHVLNRARAIENTRFVVSPCAIGPIPGGGAAYGHSLIITPWGEIVADGGTLPGVVQARIDLDLIAQTQARIPSLTHDRDFAFSDNRNVA